jgi:hypothetical protein
MRKNKKLKLEKNGYCVKETADLLDLSVEDISLIEGQKEPKSTKTPHGDQTIINNSKILIRKVHESLLKILAS